MAMQYVKRVIGDEYDEVLRGALRAVLVDRGAVGVNSSTSIGGSQEVEEINVQLDGHVITVESETYMGITIFGPQVLVEAIIKDVMIRLRK